MRPIARLCLTPAALMALLLPACNDKDSSDDSALSGGNDETDGTGTDDGPAFEPYPARSDIKIVAFTANQGTEIPVDINGSWVGPEGRNSPIFDGRNTLFRVYWDVDEATFVPRAFRGVLTLTYPDGTSKEFKSNQDLIDRDSRAYDLGKGAFYFGVEAEDMRAGAKYHFEMLELDEGYEGQAESELWQLPSGKENEIVGIQSEFMQFKVVIVPVVYDNQSTCMRDTSTLEPEVWDQFRHYLFQQDPMQEEIVTIRETPIYFNYNITSLAQLFNPLTQAREEDNADPNTYYFALISPCKAGVDGAGGIAPTASVPPVKEAAGARISVGIWLNGNAYSYETFVHELGHNQGMQHVFCPGGNSAGNDPTFPEPNGHLRAWGFGVRDFYLHDPETNFDYMTYCGPTWPSDWHWQHTFTQIRALSSWDLEDAQEPGGTDAPIGPKPKKVLMGIMLKDGTTDWWAAQDGYADAMAMPGHELEVVYSDGRTTKGPAHHSVMDDGNIFVMAPLPEEVIESGPAIISELRYVHDGVSEKIEVAKVDRLAPAPQ